MDYLLPSDETMKKMAAEYSRMLSDVDKKAAALTCSAPVGKDCETTLCGCLSGAQLLFALYFAFALGYNSGYGNAVADSDGNMGRLQSRKRRDGDFDYFFPRK